MKVNFAYFGQVPQLNGAATFFESLSQKKVLFEQELGMCVSFSCLKNRLRPRETKKTQINVYRFVKKILCFFLPKTILGTKLFLYVFYFRNAKRVVQMMDYSDDDVFIFNDIFVGIEFLKSKKKYNKKIILILHNDGFPISMLEENLPKIKKVKSFNESLLNLIHASSRIVVLSSLAKINFLKLYSCTNDKLTVINNGVELPKQEISTNPFFEKKLTGICVGSVSYRKGHDILVNVMKILHNENKLNLNIYCLGNIVDEAIVQDSVPGLFFLDGVARKDIVNYLANSDFFILCSRNEGVPLVILEAMQFGLPIFASDVGGIPDVIDGTNGMLFHPDDNSVKDVLINICSGVYDLKTLGKNAKESYMSLYSLDTMISKYVGMIKEVCNE